MARKKEPEICIAETVAQDGRVLSSMVLEYHGGRDFRLVKWNKKMTEEETEDVRRVLSARISRMLGAPKDS